MDGESSGIVYSKCSKGKRKEKKNEPGAKKSVSVFYGCQNNVLQTEWFKQQRLLSHRVLEARVQDQGSGRFSFWGRFTFWLADGPLLNKFSHIFSSLHV